MPPPLWRSSVWAGLFCDPYVANTDLEGGLGSCGMAAYGRRLASAAARLFPDAPGALSQVVELAARLAAGAALSVVRDRGAAAAAPADPVAPFQRHYDALRALAPGGYAVLDAGWLIPGASGHAIVIIIGRDADCVTGSLTVCNSGDGVEFHPVSVAAHPKTKYRTALHLGGIPWWRLDDDGFVYELLRPYVPGLADRTCCASAAALYGSLLPPVRSSAGGHRARAQRTSPPRLPRAARPRRELGSGAGAV